MSVSHIAENNPLLSYSSQFLSTPILSGIQEVFSGLKGE
jgi:hypothetical protein